MIVFIVILNEFIDWVSEGVWGKAEGVSCLCGLTSQPSLSETDRSFD